MIPMVSRIQSFFTRLIFLLLKLLTSHKEAAQTVLRRQRNFRNQVTICAKDRKAFNIQISQQWEPKTIFRSLSI